MKVILKLKIKIEHCYIFVTMFEMTMTHALLFSVINIHVYLLKILLLHKTLSTLLN